MVVRVWRQVAVTSANVPKDSLETTVKRNYFVFQIHAITMENVWRQFRAIDAFVKLDSKENNVQILTHATQTLVNKEANVKIYMDMPSADVILGITDLIVKTNTSVM